MRDYIGLLKDSGLKATFQRINILELIDKYGHISVEEIYEEIKKIHPSISLATIYKNIILMLNKNVLTEVPVVGKKSKYELFKDDHIHLICTKCGNVEDRASIDSADEILFNVTKEEHFKLAKQQINLYGTCNSCQ